MHVTTLLLALLTTAPPESIAAERWIPLPSNPALEVYGKEDAAGQFRYSAMRRKAELVTKNYGVNLSDHVPSPGSPVVMGTDGETAALLISKASAGTSKPCAHSDCPNDRCDRKPKPRPKPPENVPELGLPHFRFEFKPIHAAIAIAGLGVLMVGFIFIVTCVVIIKLLARLFYERPQS